MFDIVVESDQHIEPVFSDCLEVFWMVDPALIQDTVYAVFYCFHSQ